MGFRKKHEFKASVNNFGIEYLSQISKEVVSLKPDEVKIIPDINGNGYTIATRIGDNITIVSEYITRRGKTVSTNVLEIKKDGVYYNGRKL